MPDSIRYPIFYSSYGGSNSKGYSKLNNALIFDLFMNFEMTEKNSNLSTIIDYFPNLNIDGFKSIKVVSNIGGVNEISLFSFNDKGYIEKLTYEVNDKIYTYDFIYDGNQLSGANIGGKKKIGFNYDKEGKLLSITREQSGISLEYNFEYIAGENKANIKLIVIQGEKRSPSPRKYYASWNDDYKLTAYSIDVYSGKNLKYLTTGDLVTYSFANANEDNNELNWYYSFDDKRNWIEMKNREATCKRTIEYK